ncbi:MAG: TIGR04076 family protein, partial [Acidimicrobiia bacterium]|nr:TIGR04076 family protein [Acidimicrobiia bacterium]
MRLRPGRRPEVRAHQPSHPQIVAVRCRLVCLAASIEVKRGTLAEGPRRYRDFRWYRGSRIVDRDSPKEPTSGEPDDSFTLWDLRVEVVAGPTEMVCKHEVGDFFEVSGENLSLPPGQTFPIYPLAALLPLLPAKQRMTHPNDWMTTDAEIACPDPLCGGRFRIIRTGKSVF